MGDRFLANSWAEFLAYPSVYSFPLLPMGPKGAVMGFPASISPDCDVERLGHSTVRFPVLISTLGSSAPKPGSNPLFKPWPHLIDHPWDTDVSARPGPHPLQKLAFHFCLRILALSFKVQRHLVTSKSCCLPCSWPTIKFFFFSKSDQD